MKTFLLLCSFACTLHAAEKSPLKLLQSIPLPGVKGRFDHFAIDSKGRRLFVAALGNNTLEVIDLAVGKRIRSVPGMAKPTGVLYLPEVNQIFVANGDDGKLKILSGSDYKVLHELTSFADADNLRLDSKTKVAWLGYGDGALAMMDRAAAKSVADIKLPAHPESFQLEPEGNRMFVNLPDARQIAVIDREHCAVIANWPMEKFQGNFPMALDATNHRLFVGCRKPARLVVLNTDTGKLVADLGISEDTDDLFNDVTRNRVYISCGGGFINTVQQTTPDAYAKISELPTAPGARTSFYSAELDRFYLAVPQRSSQAAEIRVYQPQ
jgi:DNA-binding beta-propeller fold protein YncE